MSEHRISSRYAKSLLDLAVEQKKLEKINEDMLSLGEVVENRDFYVMLKSPLIKPDKKIKIFNTLFEGKYDELTLAFLNILARKGREVILADIVKAFKILYKKEKNISTVTFTTAVEMGMDTIEAIKKKLHTGSFTSKNIEIYTEVDPDIIGGFIVRFDDKIYDASISNKLDELRKEFKDNLYISQIIAN